MTTSTDTNKFIVGRRYACRSVCNHNCVWVYTITRRTEKSVWISENGEEARCKRISTCNGLESIMPKGSYSMAPMLDAGDLVTEAPAVEAVEPEVIEVEAVEPEAAPADYTIENGCTEVRSLSAVAPEVDSSAPAVPTPTIDARVAGRFVSNLEPDTGAGAAGRAAARAVDYDGWLVWAIARAALAPHNEIPLLAALDAAIILQGGEEWLADVKTADVPLSLVPDSSRFTYAIRFVHDLLEAANMATPLAFWCQCVAEAV